MRGLAGAGRAPRGATFIETIGVLTVAVVILAGALALYGEASTSARVNRTTVAVGALAGAARALHAGSGRYSPAATVPRGLVRILVASGSVPPGMLVVDGGPDPEDGRGILIRHPFGGQVFAYGLGEEFAISLDALDEDVCVRIAVESTAGGGAGLRRLVIGGATGRDPSEPPPESSLPAGLLLADLLSPGPPARAEGRLVAGGGGPAGGGGLPVPPEHAALGCAPGRGANSISWLFR